MEEIENKEGKIYNRREVELPLGYIEIFSRTGKVKYRVPVRQLGLRLGRAYDNDIILDDPYICPHHASFHWINGRLVAQDLNSINGIYPEGKKQREESIQLASGDKLRVGRTTIRFCGADMPVAKTQIEPSALSPVRLFEHPLSLITIYVVMLAYAGLNFYLDTTVKFDALKFTFELISVVAIVILWSSMWAFVSRLIIHRWNFLIHCGIASLGLIAFSLFELFSSYICFAFGVDSLLSAFAIVGYPVLTALLIYHQLRYVSLASPSKIAKASLGVALGAVCLFVAVSLLEQKNFNYFPRYSVTLKSPKFKFVESEKTDKFFALSADFKKSVDQLTRKAK